MRFPLPAVQLAFLVGAFLSIGQLAAAQLLLGPLLSPATEAATPGDQPTEPETGEADQQAEPLKEKRKQVAEQLRVAQRTEPTETDKPEPPATEASQREVDLLKRLEVTLAQQQAAVERQKELNLTQEEVKAQLDSLRINGPTEPRPYDFALLESLTNALAVERGRLETDSTAIKTAISRRDRAKEEFEQAQAARRQAKEAVSTNKDPAKTGKLAVDLKLAELKSQLAEAVLDLRQAELENQKLGRDVQQTQVTLLEEKVQFIRPSVRFTRENLKQSLLEIRKQEDHLKRQIELSEKDIEFAKKQEHNARQRLEKQVDSDQILQAEVDRWNAEHTMLTRQKQLWTKQLEWLGLASKAWKHRYEAASGNLKPSELNAIQSEVNDTLSVLQGDRATLEQQISDTRNDNATFQTKVEAEKEPSQQLVRWRRDHREALQQELDLESQQVARLEETVRLYEKLGKAVGEQTSSISLQAAGQKLWDQAVYYWNFELTSAGEQSVTVGKVVLGLLLVLAGFLLSRRFSRALGQRILPRLGVEAGAASALETLSFYALMLVSALLALRMVNVPLTVFTFLGGAVAIGVGFGSQNIINNFISGLILLAERPVRVGDIIEYDGLAGAVKTIGMRSTRILTGTNLEIIVPNSALLENNVTNWTLADTTVRCCVPVGVAYGSPTRDVAKWLRHAADNHGLVMSKPEPFVWFVGFGDSTLDFELHFFVAVRTLGERKTIESDLRFMIDGLLREAGITIAFPQRDVHLTTQRPLDVRMLPPEETPPEPASSEKAA